MTGYSGNGVTCDGNYFHYLFSHLVTQPNNFFFYYYLKNKILMNVQQIMEDVMNLVIVSTQLVVMIVPVI